MIINPKGLKQQNQYNGNCNQKEKEMHVKKKREKYLFPVIICLTQQRRFFLVNILRCVVSRFKYLE